MKNPSDKELASMKVIAGAHANKVASNQFDWQFERDKKFAQLIVEWALKPSENSTPFTDPNYDTTLRFTND